MNIDIDINKFNNLKQKRDSLVSKREFLKEEINELQKKFEAQESRYNSALRVRVIIQNSAQKIQQNISSVISNIVTKAIQSVFDKEYIYNVEFVQRRNKTECDLYLTLDGNKMSMLGTNGGGLTDIVSFANRIAFWKMDNLTRTKRGANQVRNLIIADEPFKFLHSPKLQKKCSNMLISLAEEFDLQMIIVSDQEDLTGHKNFKMIDGRVNLI